MRKIFITLGIYIIFISGIIYTLTSLGMIWLQQSGRLPNEHHHSFLAQWFNITYFEEKEQYKEQYEDCMHRPDTYGLYKNQNEKEFACAHSFLAGSDDYSTPNFKPGIMYGIFGIGCLFLGIKLRKKYLTHV